MARPNAQQRSSRQSPRTGGDGAFRGLGNFQRKLAGLSENLLPTVLELGYDSIVEGSAITGAPGQPEDERDLKESWRVEMLSPSSGRIVTDSEYALPNEDGVRQGGKPYVQRSVTGGRHSVKLTRRGFQKLVQVAATQSLAGVK